MKLDEIKNLSNNNPIVLYFSAEWCSPCKALKPKFLDWSEKQTIFQTMVLDVEQTPDIVEQLNISALPFIVILNKGDVVSSMSGTSVNFQSFNQLIAV